MRTTAGAAGEGDYAGAGGTGGNGGAAGTDGTVRGGGGGGLLTSGTINYGGTSFVGGGNGGYGYTSGGYYGYGGFGGGGASGQWSGGGGGGYSGGGGGGYRGGGYLSGGGGGGSYAAPSVSRTAYLATTDYTGAVNTSNGYVTIRTARSIQTITFPAIADRTYGDPAFALSATSDAGLTPTYASLTPTICSVTVATVTLLRSGTCTIQAYNTGDATYDADTKQQSFAIARAPLTITASSTTLNYGDAIPTITPSYTGLQYSETASAGLVSMPSCTTAYTVTSTAGTTPSTTCSGASSNKYTIAYTAGTVTVNQRPVTITASNHTLAFGAAVPTVTFTLGNMANSETATVFSTQPTCTTTYRDGDVPSTVNTTACAGAVAVNYMFSYVGGTITTTPKTITVTASSHTRVYGDPDIPAPTPSYSGWENGDTDANLTALASCSTTYSVNSTVPAGATTSCSGAAAPNYNFSYVGGVVTVQKRTVNVTASDGTTVYGTTAPTISPIYTAADFVNGQTWGVVSGMSCLTAWAATTNVGATPRSYCQSGTATNYQFSYHDGVVSVTQKALTVQASSPSVLYGAAVPTITASYTGLVNGDTQSNFSTPPTCTTDYTVLHNVGQTPATYCSGAVALNYSFPTYNNGAVTITKRTIAVRAQSYTVTYGDQLATVRRLPT
ncbi:MAG: MBG domain-containing protein, partial [Gaiellales bacterium]